MKKIIKGVAATDTQNLFRLFWVLPKIVRNKALPPTHGNTSG
jgi:hypothetical protein